MSEDVMTLAHAGAGMVTLGLYWLVLLRRKGGVRHKRSGWAFFASWGVTLATVGLLAGAHAGAGGLALPALIQLVYLSLCVLVVSATAVRSRRLRHDLERFRGGSFRLGGGVILGLGLVLLVAGLSGGEIQPIAFSSVGLLFGGAMLRFAFLRAPVHPNWSLIWHLNAVIFLFNAVHGTVLAVALRRWIWPEAGDGLNVATHVATLGLCLGLRLWYGRVHGAPMALAGRRLAPRGVAHGGRA